MTDDGTIELYAFRYRDPLTGRWTKPRHKAAREEIAVSYAEWELLGPPEVRRPMGDGYFNPLRCGARASNGGARGARGAGGRPPGAR